MIGKKQLQLGYDQFIQGMSSNDYAGDGALGTSSDGLNPFSQQGVMRPIAGLVNNSTNFSGNMVASCEDSQVVSPVNRVIKDDSANLYSWGGTSITKQMTSFAKVYSFGVTDMASFAGSTYISSTTHLAQVNTSTWTMTEAFKVFNDASAFHPLLVYGPLLYFGDGNLLKSLDTGGTVVTVLTLVTTEKIVALGIDPGSGLMLISTQSSYNPTDSVQQRGYIYMYDGVSTTFARKIVMDDMVCAFYAVGGIVYIGTGSSIGIWNGAGVTFLRRLSNVTLVTGDLPYKHHFSHIKNVLFVVNGTYVVAYGEVIAGKKAFYNFARNSFNSNNIISICPLGGNQFGMAFSSNQFYMVDLLSTAAGSNTMYFSNIYFPRPISVHRIRIITTGVTATNQFGIGGVTFFDEKSQQFASIPQTFVNQTGATKYVFDFDYGGTIIQGFAPRINMDTQNVGIIKILMYYDVIE